MHERIHPDRDECIEQLFVDAGVEPPDDSLGEVPAADPDEDEVDVQVDDENDELPDDGPEDDSDAAEDANGEEPIENDENDTVENIT